MSDTSVGAGKDADSRHRPLRIVFLSHSDNLGGAAVVTRRLMHALRNEGVDARMIVFNKLSDDEAVIPVGAGRFRRGWSFLTERALIALANGFSRENLFKVSTASTGLDPVDKKWIRDADVIVLTWINQGLLSLSGIRSLGLRGKPLVWIMHDMWNLTGICHHAYDCRRYTVACGACPLLKGEGDNDLSATVWRRKKKLYDTVPIKFVAVSHWLADRARESSLLRDRDVCVIPNAFPVDSFKTEPSIKFSYIPDGYKVILMGAARLDDPIKGLNLAVEALNDLFDNHPEAARNTIMVFFGQIRDENALADLRFPHVALGRINDARMLREIYARASVVLSTSHYETLPGTLIEGQAAGCLPVTFGHGGQDDIVDHKVNGYIARYPDTADVVEGLLWALEQTPDRQALHEHVRERFSSRAIAGRFITLFEDLVGGASRD